MIALRPRAKVDGVRPPARRVTVAFPSRWRRSTFLAYCRREHPDETVRLVEWRTVSPPSDDLRARLWLANPAAFSDYRNGTPR